MVRQREYSPLIKPTEEMLRSRRRQVFQMYPNARVFLVQEATPVLKIDSFINKMSKIPEHITLVTPNQNNINSYNLFVGSQPVARENWTYDKDTHILKFKQGDGETLLGGHLRMVKDMTSGYGLLQIGDALFNVQIHVKPVTYDMKVATTSAAYVAGTSTNPQLKWDAGSDAWKNASWSDNNMRFTYGIESAGTIAGQPVYFIKCAFEDLVTNEKWEPVYGTYIAYLSTDLMLTFSLNTGYFPQPDPSNPFLTFKSKRFPYLLNAQLDSMAITYNGAMLCEQPNLMGTVYAVQGTYDNSSVNGLYTLVHDKMPSGVSQHVIAVHDGKMLIDNEKVTTSSQTGNRLEWYCLPEHMIEKAGLPSEGYLQFSPDGSNIIGGSNNAQGYRISPNEGIKLQNKLSHLPNLRKTLAKAAGQTGTNQNSLNFMDLFNLDQFQKDQNGWYDSIQQNSMKDFYDIIQYYMPSDLRQQFVSPNPPNLDATVKGISQMPGKSGTPASTFYNTLSTAYLTGMLSQWVTEADSKYLNGIRANKWISKQTGISDVFAVQGPQLYANRYIEKNPIVTQFINDQNDNAAAYSGVIDEDVAKWKQEMKDTVEADDEQMTELLNSLDDIAAHGKNNQYWSYVMLRYTLTPGFLNMLQVISFNPGGIDGSEFMRRVQRTAAVLNVLDTSSYFTEQFVYNIQIFQMSNILPQLIDYSGDLDSYSYAVNAIILQFINDYVNSPDPNMQEAAKEFQQLMEQKKIDDILVIYQQAAVGLAGLYNWGQLVTTFQSKVAKVFGALPKIAVNGIALTAVVFGVMAFATGQIKWQDLTTSEKAAIIGSGVGMLAQMLMLVVKRGVAIATIWVPGSGFGQGLKLFFSPKLMTKAQAEATTGFKRWLLSDGGMPAEGGANALEVASLTAREGAAVESKGAKAIRFLFGRNLNEFLATRFGTIVAVGGIIMSAICLAHSSDPLEISANALFLFGSCLDLICTAGAWVIGGFALETTTLGAFAVGTLFPILGVISAIAIIAGAVLMIIFMSKQPPSPVKTFAENQAKDAGYYMPYGTEIDYFEIYQQTSQPQMAGLSLTCASSGSNTLKMQADGSVTLGTIDHTANTAFYMQVDEFGRVSFIAPLTDSQNKNIAKCLTLDDSKNITASAPITDTTKSSQQLWRAEMTGDATWDSDKHLVSAPFAFYNEYYNTTGDKQKIYFVVNNGVVTTSTTPQTWTVQMVTTAPEGLTMNDFNLYVYNKDCSQAPSLIMVGSTPKTWSISPALPSFLDISTGTGMVFQKTGVTPSQMDKSQFTLSVSNCVGSASANFNIQVLAADTP